jgi:hypothetical protein
MNKKEHKMKNAKIESQNFRKGNLVKAAPVDKPFGSPIKGFYHLTAEEIDEWRADKRAATIAAREKGEDTFHINFDSGGESRLAPRHRWQELNPNMVYEVLRARCRVQCGYHMQASQVKILDTETGRILYCDRDALVVVG